jgi:hypothetical protein
MAAAESAVRHAVNVAGVRLSSKRNSQRSEGAYVPHSSETPTSAATPDEEGAGGVGGVGGVGGTTAAATLSSVVGEEAATRGDDDDQELRLLRDKQGDLGTASQRISDGGRGGERREGGRVCGGGRDDRRRCCCCCWQARQGRAPRSVRRSSDEFIVRG